MDRPLSALSGGELQRAALAVVFCACAATDPQEDDNGGRSAAVTVIIDEPSSYLDVGQRVAMARLVRKMVADNR